MQVFPTFSILESGNWSDYALLDSGEGQKLERYGPYIFIRPEVQAMWSQSLPKADWSNAHAIFQPTREERGGNWKFTKKVAKKWQMKYGSIRFNAMPTSGRHLGVFPECAAQWDWSSKLIRGANRSINVLNLFGYTGLASLSSAAAGAHVTHVDASRKAIGWARENQVLSGLTEKPIRWIVDDALKFVQRERRRGKKYEGIMLDPPIFGRGPKGEVWEIFKSLPILLEACRQILSDKPLFLVATLYAVNASALHIGQALMNLMSTQIGEMEVGELVTKEASAGRLLSQAVFARWSSGEMLIEN